MNNFDSKNQIQLAHNNYLQLENTSLNKNDSFYKMLNYKTEEFFDSKNLTYEPWLTVLIAIIATIMSSITIIGNVFVITAFIIDKNLRKYSNYFILNLSIADLLIGILIPPYAPFLLQNRLWRFGKSACKIWLVFDYVVGSASVLCIVVISLDRYLLVSRGLKYVASQKVFKAIIIMLTVWLIAFLNYAPAIVFWEDISGKQTVKEGECQVAFHNNLVYLTATACVEFFAPLISICGLNLAVYLNIRKRSRGLIRSENPQFCLDKNVNKVNTNNQNTKKNVDYKKEIDEKKIDANVTKMAINKKKDSKKQTNKSVEKPLSASPSSTFSSSSVDDLNNNISNNKSNINKNVSKSNEKKFLINEIETKFNLQSNRRHLISQALESNHNACTSILAPLPNQIPSQSNSQNSNSNNNNNNYAHAKMKKVTNNRTLTKDKKAARSLFILVFTFVFCWAPYTFLTLIKAVCPNCINDHFYEFAFWLLWFNSTLNPILYPFLHVKFRKAFLKIIQYLLFCVKFKKKGYKPANTTNVNSNYLKKFPSNV